MQPPSSFCWYSDNTSIDEQGLVTDCTACFYDDADWFKHMIEEHGWSEERCLSEWNIGISDDCRLTEVPK